MANPELDIIRHTRIAVASLVTLLILSLVGGAITWRLSLSHDVNRRLADLRAAGLPTSGPELNRWYPAVPDSQNAALVLTQAFALMRTFPDQRSNEVARFKPPPRGQTLTPGQVQLLSEYTKLNSAALDKATEALKLPMSRFPVDLAFGANPRLGRVRTLAKTAGDEALLAVDAQRASDLWKSLTTILGLGRTLEQEPQLVSQLTRIAILKIGQGTLELRLNAGQASESELTDLAAAFARAERTNSMIRGLAGEQALAIPHFHMSGAEIDRPSDADEDGVESPREPHLAGREPLLFRTTGFFELDLQFYLEVMETNIALARFGPPKSLGATNLERTVEKSHFILSGLLLPGVLRATLREAEGLAYVRLATTALAVERFRPVNHRLPKDLDELVPQFLSAVPQDPFDGALLRYRRLPKGYIVYSVGPDGRDDGGKEPPPTRRGACKGPKDITFTVER